MTPKAEPEQVAQRFADRWDEASLLGCDQQAGGADDGGTERRGESASLEIVDDKP